MKPARKSINKITDAAMSDAHIQQFPIETPSLQTVSHALNICGAIIS